MWASEAAPQRLRFSGWGNGSEAEVRAARRRPSCRWKRPATIAAVGLQGDDVLINDPYYKERTTLASYAGRVKSSRLFTPSQDLRAITVTVPGRSRVQVTDATGRVVGTLAKGAPATVQESAKRDLPGSSSQFEEQWRDPSCTERPPREGAGVNSLHIPMPESGTYRVRAINHDGNETSVTVYTYDVNGFDGRRTRVARKSASISTTAWRAARDHHTYARRSHPYRQQQYTRPRDLNKRAGHRHAGASHRYAGAPHVHAAHGAPAR
jgi:hypothetical protein